MWFPVCPLFRGTFVLKSRWEFESCPLSRIKKRPPLGGCLCISTVVISMRNTAFVRCREVVRFLEGPLWEVRLCLFSSACLGLCQWTGCPGADGSSRRDSSRCGGSLVVY